MLGFELESSARAVCALIHRAISNPFCFINTQTVKSLVQGWSGGSVGEVLVCKHEYHPLGPSMMMASSGRSSILAKFICFYLAQNVRSCFFVSRPMMRPRLEVLVSEALHQICQCCPSHVQQVLCHGVTPHSACILFCLHSACAPSELGTCSVI